MLAAAPAALARYRLLTLQHEQDEPGTSERRNQSPRGSPALPAPPSSGSGTVSGERRGMLAATPAALARYRLLTPQHEQDEPGTSERRNQSPRGSPAS